MAELFLGADYPDVRSASIFRFVTFPKVLQSLRRPRDNIFSIVSKLRQHLWAPFESPVRYEDLVAKHNEVMAEKVSKKRLYKYVELLRDIGWVDTVDDPEDKRRHLVHAMKTPDKSSYSSLRQSTPFFHETDFKNWLEALKNYSSPEEIFIYKNLQNRERYAILGNPSSDLENHFKATLFQEENFPEPFKPEQEAKLEKDHEISSDEEKDKFAGLSHLEVTLREKFSRGTQHDFAVLAKQLDPSLTESEAETLFCRMVDEGAIAMDPEGWWRWIR